MKKTRNQDADIFVRRPMVALRASLDRLEIAAEADVAGREPFMEAAIAAAMIIAHADGDADNAERQRIIAQFRTAPLLRGFSAGDVAREIETHLQAFAIDHDDAEEKARGQIVTAELSDEQFRALVSICVSVLEADGVRHPAEEEALAGISALRLWGQH